ncbi:hypothetical protein SS50377_28626 [Spironucleus salmonicida]|uniref:Uncharacterized protein n=1 Tax=Spironucleus salmonicida TaxID=348837 RepID=A0A9P8LKD1_9EUKA|nr:hypothetical protein SS50377_28626 [Spironucleus salmonicida]
MNFFVLENSGIQEDEVRPTRRTVSVEVSDSGKRTMVVCNLLDVGNIVCYDDLDERDWIQPSREELVEKQLGDDVAKIMVRISDFKVENMVKNIQNRLSADFEQNTMWSSAKN